MGLEMLRKRIIDEYCTVRKFGYAIGFSESMLSKMLSGKRKIYPYTRTIMADKLMIARSDYKLYFGDGENEEGRSSGTEA